MIEMSDSQPDLPESLRNWLEHAVRRGASDLHLIVGYPPVIRLHGDLIELSEPILEPAQATGLLMAFCPEPARAQLQAHKNADFAFTIDIDQCSYRFRANLFYAAQQLGACIRVVPSAIPEFAWAGFPIDLAKRLAAVHDGLVIVTGATGSGKTTTLAMIVNLLNQ